jgi:hypothetical protein
MSTFLTFASGDGICFQPTEEFRIYGKVIEANPTCITFQEIEATHRLWGVSDAEAGKIHVVTKDDGQFHRHKLTRAQRDTLAAIA